MEGGVGAVKEQADKAHREATDSGKEREEKNPSARKIETLDKIAEVMGLNKIDGLFKEPSCAGGDKADESRHHDQKRLLAHPPASELLKESESPDAGHPRDFPAELLKFQNLIEWTFRHGPLLSAWLKRPREQAPRRRVFAQILPTTFAARDRFRNDRGGQ